MKFWPRNVLQMMANEIDYLFLLSMMSDLKTSMGGEDKAAISQEKKSWLEKTKNPSEKINAKMTLYIIDIISFFYA